MIKVFDEQASDWIIIDKYCIFVENEKEVAVFKKNEVEISTSEFLKLAYQTPAIFDKDVIQGINIVTGDLELGQVINRSSIGCFFFKSFETSEEIPLFYITQMEGIGNSTKESESITEINDDKKCKSKTLKYDIYIKEQSDCSKGIFIAEALIISDSGHEETVSAGFTKCSSESIEVMAALVALDKIGEGNTVTIHSSNPYLIDGFNKSYVYEWEKSNWENGEMPNKEVWKEMLQRVRKQADVKFKRSRGLNKKQQAYFKGKVTPKNI